LKFVRRQEETHSKSFGSSANVRGDFRLGRCSRATSLPETLIPSNRKPKLLLFLMRL
jgi:hypothetical protein